MTPLVDRKEVGTRVVASCCAFVHFFIFFWPVVASLAMPPKFLSLKKPKAVWGRKKALWIRIFIWCSNNHQLPMACDDDHLCGRVFQRPGFAALTLRGDSLQLPLLPLFCAAFFDVFAAFVGGVHKICRRGLSSWRLIFPYRQSHLNKQTFILKKEPNSHVQD